jgi:hypothetical protein
VGNGPRVGGTGVTCLKFFCKIIPRAIGFACGSLNLLSSFRESPGSLLRSHGDHGHLSRAEWDRLGIGCWSEVAERSLLLGWQILLWLGAAT